MFRFNPIYAATMAFAAVSLVGCNNNHNSGYTDSPTSQAPTETTGGEGSPAAPMVSMYVQSNTPNQTGTTAIGDIFTAENGLALYTFEKDEPGKSNCNGHAEGECADIWPPLYADADSIATGDYSVVQRDDGSAQWAFKDYPLYFYKFDAEPGDVNGENINEVWFVARPDPIATGTTNLGTILTGEGSISLGDGAPENRKEFDGFTLYTFTVDAPGVSNCNGLAEGECAEIWPPLYADKGARASGDFSIIDRNDASSQWAFKDYPLYFFKNDAQAGDTNGEDVNSVWYVARPDPITITDSSLGSVYAGSGSIRQGDGDPANRRDLDGLTLYTFANDEPGQSNCNGLAEGECADIWPPLYADKEARASGDFSIIDRNDGSKQWTLNELPLYFYKFDEEQGDVNGHLVNNVWFAAQP